MKPNPIKIQRTNPAPRGQGMVEFALILPLLLLLMLGVIEVGRLLVIYSSVQAASREAGRYAAASGDSASGVPYYLDTTGITEAARRVALLVPIDTVNITYDHGPTTPITTFTPASASDVNLRDRVVVTVSANYTPLWGITPLKPFAVSSTTRRTIVKEVPVVGFSNAGGGTVGSPPVVTINSPFDGASFEDGETITFAGTAIDNPDGSLTGNLQWFANGTAIGTGGSFTLNTLTPDTYVITAEVLDSDGNTGSDSVSIVVNPKLPPELTIISPSAGDAFEQGQVITFQATATDDKDGDVTASITWVDNLDGTLGTGGNFTRNNLSVGTHVVTISVKDSDNLPATQTLTFSVSANLQPVLKITSPADGSHVPNTSPVSFTGTATDSLLGDISSTIVWKDEKGNTLGTGGSISTTALALGTHTITASVTDTITGVVVTAIITIYVDSNQPPTITITAPANGTTVEINKLITFTAVAKTVPGNVDISGSIKWYVDDSTVASATGASFPTSSLAAGTRKITAKVIDSNLMTASTFINVTINNLNTNPVVSILSITTANNPPMPFKTTKPAIFTGQASDAEDGPLSTQIKWFSSINGYLGQGSTITKTLSAGVHTISAVITDTKLVRATATQSLTVKTALCPSPTTATFTRSGNDLLSLSWSLTVNGVVGSETFRLLSLEFSVGTLTSTGRVSGIKVDSVARDFVGNGVTPARITAPYDIVRTSNTKIDILITFSPSMNRKNDNTFNIKAQFDGCPVIDSFPTP